MRKGGSGGVALPGAEGGLVMGTGLADDDDALDVSVNVEDPDFVMGVDGAPLGVGDSGGEADVKEGAAADGI